MYLSSDKDNNKNVMRRKILLKLLKSNVTKVSIFAYYFTLTPLQFFAPSIA